LPSSDTKTPPASHAQQLEFPDNRLLIDLCGPYDANLTAVETALEVQIVRRGNHLSVMGEEDATSRAASVLEGLYARLEGGRSVEPADVTSLLRMGDSAAGTGVRPGDQIEMPNLGGVEIQTRKKRVEPRTAAQKAYVQSLFDNELPVRVKPILRWPSACRCSSGATWTVSSCRALPWRRGRSWATCPVT
jgi:phosphate starvation-inducible PhoH-like protein